MSIRGTEFRILSDSLNVWKTPQPSRLQPFFTATVSTQWWRQFLNRLHSITYFWQKCRQESRRAAATASLWTARQDPAQTQPPLDPCRKKQACQKNRIKHLKRCNKRQSHSLNTAAEGKDIRPKRLCDVMPRYHQYDNICFFWTDSWVQNSFLGKNVGFTTKDAPMLKFLIGCRSSGVVWKTGGLIPGSWLHMSLGRLMKTQSCIQCSN